MNEYHHRVQEWIPWKWTGMNITTEYRNEYHESVREWISPQSTGINTMKVYRNEYHHRVREWIPWKCTGMNIFTEYWKEYHHRVREWISWKSTGNGYWVMMNSVTIQLYTTVWEIRYWKKLAEKWYSFLGLRCFLKLFSLKIQLERTVLRDCRPFSGVKNCPLAPYDETKMVSKCFCLFCEDIRENVCPRSRRLCELGQYSFNQKK